MLSASIYTEADDLTQLREAVRGAVGCHFEDGERPAIIPCVYRDIKQAYR